MQMRIIRIWFIVFAFRNFMSKKHKERRRTAFTANNLVLEGDERERSQSRFRLYFSMTQHLHSQGWPTSSRKNKFMIVSLKAMFSSIFHVIPAFVFLLSADDLPKEKRFFPELKIRKFAFACQKFITRWCVFVYIAWESVSIPNCFSLVGLV